MITPNDIRNPSRKSGYDHVSRASGNGRTVTWRAIVGAGKSGAGDAEFVGRARKSPEEAAQDYCDYINAKKPLTIEDIRNPKRKSGFDHVSMSTGNKPYQAYWGGGHNSRTGKRTSQAQHGPRRASAAEAGQDYCDYINGQRGSAPATLASHGHTRRARKAKIEYTPEERAAQKLLREAAAKRKADKGNFVYLVGEDSDPSWVKIGEAYDPEDRYIGGQTFNPRTLVLLGYQKAEQPRGADKALHRKFAQHHHRAEWFRPADEILSHFNITKSEFLRRCGGTTKEVKTV